VRITLVASLGSGFSGGRCNTAAGGEITGRFDTNAPIPIAAKFGTRASALIVSAASGETGRRCRTPLLPLPHRGPPFPVGVH
jgi:hypothetical protein